MHNRFDSPRNSAFSLVELSIVLVILGLLTGGILAGQSLIRASELRAVSTEYSRYIAAVQTFRDKYFAVPGDFRDATKFWNRQGTGGDCVSNSGLVAAGSPGACDGNGDGDIDIAGAALEASDNFQFWRHLQLAGLVEGTYSGLAGTGNNTHAMRGTNVPASKLGQGAWNARSGNNPADPQLVQVDYGNMLHYGAGQASGPSIGALLKPEELWNIDSKMDDGRPTQGNVIAYYMACITPNSGGNVNTNLDQSYLLTASTLSCAALFRKAY